MARALSDKQRLGRMINDEAKAEWGSAWSKLTRQHREGEVCRRQMFNILGQDGSHMETMPAVKIQEIIRETMEEFRRREGD